MQGDRPVAGVVSEAEHAAVVAAAEHLGVSMSKYIRSALVIAAHAIQASYASDAEDDATWEIHNAIMCEEVERLKKTAPPAPRRMIPTIGIPKKKSR